MNSVSFGSGFISGAGCNRMLVMAAGREEVDPAISLEGNLETYATIKYIYTGIVNIMNFKYFITVRKMT